MKNMDFSSKRLFKVPGFCYNLNMKTETFTRQQLDQMDHEELVEAYMATQKNVRELESEVGLLKEELGQIKAVMFSRKSEKKEEITADQLRVQ